MIKKLDKLIIINFCKYFISIFLITYFIVLLSLLYDKLPLILSKNLGAVLYIRIIFYLLIFLTPYISVFSSLLGTLLFLTRFDYSLQLTALKSVGVSMRRIMLSLSFSYIFIGSAICVFTNYLSPIFKKSCFNIFKNLNNLDPALNIKSGFFINDIPNLGIYVGDKSGNKIRDIIVYVHDKDNIDSLFIAEKGEINSNTSTKITKVNIQNGYNFCEGKMFSNIIKNSKNNNINVRNYFENQDITIDMSDFFKMPSIYDSITSLDSIELYNLIQKSKKLINENIDVIMNSIDKNYRYIFDDISEKKEILLKEKIYKSLQEDKLSNKIFKKADDVISENNDNFKLIKDYRMDIRIYYTELLKRNMELLSCLILILIGTYIAFKLKRGVMISSIIIGAIFVSFYFLGESLFIRYIDINGNFYLIKKSGGCLFIILLVILFIFLKYAKKNILLLTKKIKKIKKKKTDI